MQVNYSFFTEVIVYMAAVYAMSDIAYTATVSLTLALILRVIFTYDYTPPKPHFSTRIPIACQLYEHANKNRLQLRAKIVRGRAAWTLHVKSLVNCINFVNFVDFDL